MIDREDFARANRQGAALLEKTPRAIAARYDRRRDRIIVRLDTGLEIMFRPQDAEGLETAKPAELAVIRLSPTGLGLHFPKIDADLYIPGLLESHFGSRRWMAAKLGQEGGRSKSSAKSEAARRNGRLGGRPRSNPAAE